MKAGSQVLEAKQGKATQKYAAPYGTKWMKERKIITATFTQFASYVLNNDPLEWYKTIANNSDLYTPAYISTAANKY